jgi:hypothetical protein
MNGYDAEPVERARRAAWAVADVAAFLVESACVGNGLFWLIPWGMLSFNWELTVHEYARFWTHYAKASAAARHPVEITAIVAILALTALAAWVRAPRAIQSWTAWPYSWPRRRAPAHPGNA